jgi:thioesterase domain-containing protein
MTPAELTAYLRRNIPLAAAMEVTAVSVEPERVVLKAPLAPNINHRGTVFGGSASALAILAAWSLIHLRLAATAPAHRLVIQRNTMSYDAPVEGMFTATGRFDGGTDWPRVLDMLTRRGKARVGAIAELGFDGRLVGRLEAEFVALAARETVA